MNKRRIVVISLIALVVLAALGWKGFGWWLQHKLERYRAELVARGEKLTVAELLADLKTPEHNSASTMKSAMAYLHRDGVLSSNPPPTMRLVAPGRALVGWQRPQLVDYSEQATNTWVELAAELAESQRGIEMLHELIGQPEMDFGLDYSQGFNVLLPHLAPMKASVQTLSAAAMLALQRGNTELATRHLRAMLAIAAGPTDEPLLISQLVRLAITHIAIAATWEWLQAPNLAEPELRQVQADFARLQFLSPMERSLEMERAMGAMTIRHYREQGGVYDVFGGGGGPPAPTSTTEKVIDGTKRLFSPREIRKTSNELLWQSAFSYADELSSAQGMQVLIEASRSIKTNGSFAPTLSYATARLDAMGQLDTFDGDFWPGDGDLSLGALRNLFGGTSSAFIKSLKKVQTVEAFRALAVTAIALKRYQLRYGKVPDELAALVPAYLAAVSNDPVDGQPLRYQRKPDGTFLLYSIGEDGVDNGGDGSRSQTNSTSRPNMIYGRDWVWPQPATAEEIKAWEAEQMKQSK